MPTVSDIATCTFDTKLDPFARPEVDVARCLRNRRVQRVLHPLFKPANDFEVRTVLREAAPAAEEGSEVGEPRRRAEPRE